VIFSRDIRLGILVGLSTHWIVWWLFMPVLFLGAHTFVPVLAAMHRDHGWTLAQVLPIGHLAFNVIATFLDGFALGFPLGLLVQGYWLIAWLSFLAGWVIAQVLEFTFASLHMVDLLSNLLVPEAWVPLIGTLLFITIGNQLRLRYESRRSRT
jgi:hypothetical protein